MTNVVTDRLRASGNFTQLRLQDGPSNIDYVFSGRLEKLEEIDYEGGVKVEVALSARMTSLATGTNVWSNAVSEMGQVNKRDVPAVVAVISRTMDRAIDKLLTPVASGVISASTAAKRN